MELFAADGHDAGGCERVTGKSGMRPSSARATHVHPGRCAGGRAALPAPLHRLLHDVEAERRKSSFGNGGLEHLVLEREERDALREARAKTSRRRVGPPASLTPRIYTAEVDAPYDCQDRRRTRRAGHRRARGPLPGSSRRWAFRCASITRTRGRLASETRRPIRVHHRKSDSIFAPALRTYVILDNTQTYSSRRDAASPQRKTAVTGEKAKWTAHGMPFGGGVYSPHPRAYHREEGGIVLRPLATIK